MSKKDVKRAEIVGKLAAHFLEAGLGDTGLRRLAKVAGTSDRMLLYYFENKDELVTAVLIEIGTALAATLDTTFGKGPLSPADALDALWGMVKSPTVANQLRLWLDLSSRASRGDPLFSAIVDQMTDGWIDWLAGLLDVPEKRRRSYAVLIMAAIDGQVVLFPSDLSRGDAAIAQLGDLLARG